MPQYSARHHFLAYCILANSDIVLTQPLIAVSSRSRWVRDRLMGSFLWPIATPFLICAITLPCMALVCSEERPKRILNAFSSLVNAVLSAYLGIIPMVRERNMPFITILIVAMATFAATISVVILAFFDGYGEVSATNAIPMLLGATQNYIFVTVLGAHTLEDCDGHLGLANNCYKVSSKDLGPHLT